MAFLEVIEKQSVF